MTVRSVPASVVHPLRTRILRPAWRDRLAVNPEDSLPEAYHVAAFDGGTVIGCATIYPEAPPERHRGAIPYAAYEPGASVRLRGMATADEARGTGAGRALLEACFDHARDQGHTHLWCNARIGALGFYEHLGLSTVGDEFDLPEIGGHYVMWLPL